MEWILNRFYRSYRKLSRLAHWIRWRNCHCSLVALFIHPASLWTYNTTGSGRDIPFYDDFYWPVIHLSVYEIQNN